MDTKRSAVTVSNSVKSNQTRTSATATCSDAASRSTQDTSNVGAVQNHQIVGSADLGTVVVGMSGGVDSSVTALLLAEKGYKVVGVHMTNWDPSDEEGEYVGCRPEEDLKAAQTVCQHLKIPLHRVDFVQEYWTQVFGPCLQAYEQGITPNPDVMCNRYIKFSAFLEHAQRKLGAEYIATGHYARIYRGPNGETQLMRPADPNKDQTYFLANVPHTALRKTLLPLGYLPKPQVRQIARAAGLPTANRKESMGLCFVGKRHSFGSFLSKYIRTTPGELVHLETGAHLGWHRGAELYTIGQKARVSGQPIKCFVAGKNMATGDVFLVPGGDHPALYAPGLLVKKETFLWVAGAPPMGLAAGVPLRCRGMVRYRQAAQWCTLTDVGPEYHVQFDSPVKAIAPGQLLAVYDGDVCLGGAEVWRPDASLYNRTRTADGRETGQFRPYRHA